MSSPGAWLAAEIAVETTTTSTAALLDYGFEDAFGFPVATFDTLSELG
jgi:hypothetical protein